MKSNSKKAARKRIHRHSKPRKRSAPHLDLPPRTAGDGELPPNGNVRKFPDEVYGDTEIPFRKN